MVACAKYLGRDSKTCTRGIDNCVCRREEMEPKEGIFYTNVRVEFNDGSVFEGNEVQVSLVSGFTGKDRGGVKRTEFLEGVPSVSPNARAQPLP